MKTSAIEVHDMLSVFSVDDVEKRIGEVLGVYSVTVNFAVGNATVRYDETQLEATDIKSAVRQREFEPAASASSAAGDDEERKAASGALPENPATPAASAAPPDKAPASTPPEPSLAERPAASATPEGDANKETAAPNKE